ncbi:MAG: helix-turn-helix domain-containing protein [Enterocloster sp.]
MVSYERLWKTMEKKGISQYRLINHYKISAGQIGRMKKNMHVSTHTLEVFCNILQCPVEDIVEVILDPQEPDGKEPSSAGGRAVGRTAAGARDAKKAEGVTGDKAPGKPGSRSGVQGTGKAAAATRDNASGKLASRSGVQGAGKTAAVTGEKPAGKAEDRTGGKTAGKTPAGSREGNK